MKKHKIASLSSGRDVIAGVVAGLIIGAIVFVIVQPTAQREAIATASVPPQIHAGRLADFGRETASADVRYLANWIADSNDAGGAGFVIVDKKFANLLVFDGNARLRGMSPVLLGGARGDDSVPGIGSRPIAAVLPAERTTPAGRFVGERGHNARGEDVVWVDYDAAVSMHRVLTTNPAERRLERLATPTHEDNRISYGCINVPAVFYETYVRPAFANRRAVVYVLPETKSPDLVFGSYDAVAKRAAAGGYTQKQARQTVDQL